MRTIRRLYIYAVAFISLEVVLWGLVNLLRSIFNASIIGGSAARLAGSLALILVGLPVFWLHWRVARNDAHREMDEHASGLRAFFLYAVLLSTLIPAIQSFLAIVNRLFLDVNHLSRMAAFVGGQQTWSDNLIALLMNVLLASYFVTVLRADWKEITLTAPFTNVRQISRYLWVLYGLGLTVGGVQQILSFILQVPPTTFGLLLRADFINGLALTLVGTPLWFFAWKTVQDSLVEPVERDSLLRLALLYALSLAGVITVLTSSGLVLYLLLRQVLGEGISLPVFVQQISGPLSIGIPLAGVWAYHGNWLAHSIREVPDAPRRSGLRRLYSYILSAIGMAAAFTGLQMLLAFFVDALLGGQSWGGTLRLSLTAALSTLGVGLPLWLLSWRPMQAEALSAGDAGDHARRSLVRRIYLYLALFASVIGGMIAAGSAVYTLLNALLGGSTSGIWPGLLKSIALFALFVVLGIYHGRTMGRDGRTAGQALAEKHAAFQTLIFDLEGGSFGEAMLAAIRKQTPRLPVTVKPVALTITRETDVPPFLYVNRDPPASAAGPSPEAGTTPKAVILPAGLALNPPGNLRGWLAQFKGSKLVVPGPAQGWLWVGSSQSELTQAALTLRQLAEGQEVRPRAPVTGWMIFVYVIAGLFGLEAVGLLVSFAASLFFR